VQVLENKNFAGNPLRPTAYPGAGSKPDSELYWDSTPEWAKTLARTLNEATGGNVAESGMIDISPTSISNLVDFLGAGLLNFGKDVVNLPGHIIDGDLTAKQVPLLRQYTTEPSGGVSTGLYYDNVAKILGAEKAMKAYKEGEHRDIDKYHEIRRERAADLNMVAYAKDIERQLKSLRTRMRAAQGRKDTARVEELKRRIATIQSRFNQTYERKTAR